MRSDKYYGHDTVMFSQLYISNQIYLDKKEVSINKPHPHNLSVSLYASTFLCPNQKHIENYGMYML